MLVRLGARVLLRQLFEHCISVGSIKYQYRSRHVWSRSRSTRLAIAIYLSIAYQVIDGTREQYLQTDLFIDVLVVQSKKPAFL
jgi:hypothetical protein